MFRIVRKATLDALTAEASALPTVQQELAQAKTEAERATDSAIRAENVTEQQGRQLEALRAAIKEVAGERDAAHTELEQAREELQQARAQVLLDAEDRVVLRKLLLTARKTESRTDRVYVLFHHGALHSVHASIEAAELKAEEHGAHRSGWTTGKPGAAQPPAAEVPWRIQPLPLGGVL